MIVVTGASGFIGSNLVLALNQRGRKDILCVDMVPAEARGNLDAARIRDFVDPPELLRRLQAMCDIEFVFHQGACSDTTESDRAYMMTTNYEYSVALARQCLARRIPLIYASSAAVYGHGRSGFVEHIDEEEPLNVYAESKVLFDRWIRQHAADGSVVGLRYFNVYGPGEDHKGRMASVMLHFRRQVEAGGALQVFEGSRGFKRDFVHVDDAIRVNLHFMEHPVDRPGIYNVGSGQAVSFMEVAELVAGRYDAPIEQVPFPADLRGKYQTYTRADLRALRAAGYTRSFRAAAEGVDEYLHHLDPGAGTPGVRGQDAVRAQHR